jgi:oligopeptide/dipeptide ABC transporter ATP-binding protein
MNDNLLTIDDLTVSFRTQNGIVNVLENLNIELDKGKILSVLGESGAGKSTLLSSIIGSLPDNSIIKGTIKLNGNTIMKNGTYSKNFVRNRWKYISYIPQNAMSVLNPVKRIKSHFIDTAEAYNVPKDKAIKDIYEILPQIGLDTKILNYYPHELSGGMKQRVIIALAIFLHPLVTIADEPTSALDMITQKKILELIKNINKKFDIAFIISTHDIAAASYLSNYIYVIYKGRIIERATAKEIIDNPYHPYTIYLLGNSITIRSKNKFEYFRKKIVSNDVKTTYGCKFANKCPYMTNLCLDSVEGKMVNESHYVLCNNLDMVKKDVYS